MINDCSLYTCINFTKGKETFSSSWDIIKIISSSTSRDREIPSLILYQYNRNIRPCSAPFRSCPLRVLISHPVVILLVHQRRSCSSLWARFKRATDSSMSRVLVEPMFIVTIVLGGSTGSVSSYSGGPAPKV